MTTPTKEQVEKIKKKIIKDRVELLKSCGYTSIEIGRRIEVSDVEDDIKVAIAEWEKIKDLDARVEKMCKNNPGIKDFEDFYKTINSSKSCKTWEDNK